MSKGFDSADQQIAESGSYTLDFFLKDGETAVVRFLDDEPVNIKAHFFNKRWYTCTRDETCPLCEKGIKATNQFVFNILDTREYTGQDGKKRATTVKLWRVGSKLLMILRKKVSKYGPVTGYMIEVSRMGSGQNTAWDIDPMLETRDDEFSLGKDQKLYEREAVLAPKTRAELIAVINGEVAEDVKSKNINDEDDDDDEDSVPWKQ